MTVLTAGAPGGTFEAGRIYEYELTAPGSDTRPIPWDDLAAGRDAADVPRPAGKCGRARRLPHVVPQAPRRRSRRAVARDRRHGDAVRTAPAPQPHLLVMSGDQIYADEVGHPLMPRVCGSRRI